MKIASNSSSNRFFTRDSILKVAQWIAPTGGGNAPDGAGDKEMMPTQKPDVRYASFYLGSFLEFQFHEVPNTLYDDGKFFDFAKQHRFHLDVVTSP